MAETYTRQSSFTNGDVIDAPLFNAEFDQLEAAFDGTTGHAHDGTPGGGAEVPFIQKTTANGISSISFDTSVPTAHKIVFKLNGVVINTIDATFGNTSDKIKHTPLSTGVPVALDAYLEGLEVAVGDAATDAAAAAASAAEAEVQADRAEAAAMVVGVPTILADGATFNILSTMVLVDLVCLGDATINLPPSLTAGHRYSIRVSSLAAVDKRCTINNPSYNIIGDVLTLNAGDNLELKKSELVILDVLNSTDMEII